MPFFQTEDSISLFYTTSGDVSNPPILLVHGWCADSHDWSWQIPFLSKDHYVVAYDMRGHGKSSALEDATYDFRHFVKDAAALLRHLKLEKNVIVIGHSVGGITTSVFAALEPSFVKAFVIVDPPAWQPSEVSQALTDALPGITDMNAWALGIYETLAQGDVPAWLKTWWFRRVEGMPQQVIRQTIAGMNKEGGLARMEEHVALASQRKAPRLAVYIDQEKLEMERGLGVGPLDEFATIEGVGHWPHQVKSEEFNGILGRWLEKIEG